MLSFSLKQLINEENKNKKKRDDRTSSAVEEKD